jgi:hypothetical protein
MLFKFLLFVTAGVTANTNNRFIKKLKDSKDSKTVITSHHARIVNTTEDSYLISHVESSTSTKPWNPIPPCSPPIGIVGPAVPESMCSNQITTLGDISIRQIGLPEAATIVQIHGDTGVFWEVLSFGIQQILDYFSGNNILDSRTTPITIRNLNDNNFTWLIGMMISTVNFPDNSTIPQANLPIELENIGLRTLAVIQFNTTSLPLQDDFNAACDKLFAGPLPKGYKFDMTSTWSPTFALYNAEVSTYYTNECWAEVKFQKEEKEEEEEEKVKSQEEQEQDISLKQKSVDVSDQKLKPWNPKPPCEAPLGIVNPAVSESMCSNQITKIGDISIREIGLPESATIVNIDVIINNYDSAIGYGIQQIAEYFQGQNSASNNILSSRTTPITIRNLGNVNYTWLIGMMVSTRDYPDNSTIPKPIYPMAFENIGKRSIAVIQFNTTYVPKLDEWDNACEKLTSGQLPKGYVLDLKSTWSPTLALYNEENAAFFTSECWYEVIKG